MKTPFRDRAVWLRSRRVRLSVQSYIGCVFGERYPFDGIIFFILAVGHQEYDFDQYEIGPKVRAVQFYSNNK